MYQITPFHRIVSFILIACILQSCSYYKFRTIPEGADTEYVNNRIAKRPAHKNYFIVHKGDKAWQLKDVVFVNDTLTGTITAMNPTVKEYMNKAYAGSKKRVPREDLTYINQVHVFIDSLDESSKNVAFTAEDIDRLDLMNMNRGLKIITVASAVIVTTFTALVVLLLIACSCPHTYVYDGEKYYFNNTLFTGATSENLERDDYKIMPDYFSNSGNYEFFIRNDEEEQQFTNMLELIVVQHNENAEISMDQQGKIYSLEELVRPSEVHDNSGNVLTDLVSYADDAGHYFDNKGEEDYNNVYASFEKPEDTQNAKVVLNVKNHQWGGLVFNEFSKLFGKHHDLWAKSNQKKSKEEIRENIKKAGFLLTVSVKKNGEWIELEDLDLIGDVNYNSIVIPLDSDLLTDESIELRVQSGFMFWDLDRINMDFSAPSNLSVQRLSPSSALGSNNNDDTEALASNDDKYMSHLTTGDSTTVKFEGIENIEGMNRTIFLHSKGYYLPQKQFSGKLQRKELAKINIEAGLSIFSRGLYQDYFGNLTLNTEQ